VFRFETSVSLRPAISLPYQWLFEMLSPLFELIGLATIGLAAIYGVLNGNFFVEFLIYGYAFATLISIGTVLLGEITFRRHNRSRDIFILILFCCFEQFSLPPAPSDLAPAGNLAIFARRFRLEAPQAHRILFFTSAWLERIFQF
jgi:hypothetical protein